jgi:hypothetical protein
MKMSKSKGNYIGITDSPTDMFGKAMSIPDKLMDNYFTLLTALPRVEIDKLLDQRQTHPRDAKMELGRLIVAAVCGDAAAVAAAQEFARVFSQRETPAEMPEIVIKPGSVNIIDLIEQAGFAKSRGEARRLVQQNAVKRLAEEALQDGTAPTTVDQVVADLPVGKTPQPARLALDAPAGLIGVQVGRSAGLVGELLVPGGADGRQPLPSGQQSTGRELRPQVELQDVDELIERDAQAGRVGVLARQLVKLISRWPKVALGNASGTTGSTCFLHTGQ